MIPYVFPSQVFCVCPVFSHLDEPRKLPQRGLLIRRANHLHGLLTVQRSTGST